MPNFNQGLCSAWIPVIFIQVSGFSVRTLLLSYGLHNFYQNVCYNFSLSLVNVPSLSFDYFQDFLFNFISVMWIWCECITNSVHGKLALLFRKRRLSLFLLSCLLSYSAVFLDSHSSLRPSQSPWWSAWRRVWVDLNFPCDISSQKLDSYFLSLSP